MTFPNGLNNAGNQHPVYYMNTGGHVFPHTQMPTSTPPLYYTQQTMYSSYQYPMPPPPAIPNSVNTGIYGIPSQPSIVNLPTPAPIQQYVPTTQYYYASPYAPQPPPTLTTVPPIMSSSIHTHSTLNRHTNNNNARGGYRKFQTQRTNHHHHHQQRRQPPHHCRDTTMIRGTHAIQSSTRLHTIPTQKTNTPAFFSCEACNLEFPSEHSYKAHISSHIGCSFPGCSFTASRKVVSGHYSSVHGKFSGRGLKTVTIQLPGSKLIQRFKICVGNHPEVGFSSSNYH